MSFAGMDCDQFPGLSVMAACNAEFAFTAYYLAPAPSHRDPGWMGQRAALAAQGWAFAPVFVGQQITGPGSHIVTETQGFSDGARAGALMEQEGFAPRSCVYLDLENGPPFASPQADYVRAWFAALKSSGFTPGVYCSHAMAADVAAANPGVRIWAFRVAALAASTAEPPFPTPEVAVCGFAGAAIWQRADAVTISVGGHELIVDLDVATTPDPSAP